MDPWDRAKERAFKHIKRVDKILDNADIPDSRRAAFFRLSVPDSMVKRLAKNQPEWKKRRTSYLELAKMFAYEVLDEADERHKAGSDYDSEEESEAEKENRPKRSSRFVVLAAEIVEAPKPLCGLPYPRHYDHSFKVCGTSWTLPPKSLLKAQVGVSNVKGPQRMVCVTAAVSSGTGFTWISQELADCLGLRRGEYTWIRGVGGKPLMAWTTTLVVHVPRHQWKIRAYILRNSLTEMCLGNDFLTLADCIAGPDTLWICGENATTWQLKVV